MPKAKPVSLHPLSFDEAIKALMSVDPEGSKLIKKKPKIHDNRKPRKESMHTD